jgi:tRNA threonylcarbamoyladenosine biosynthesis protein TsaB
MHNNQQKEHASFVQPAIKKLFNNQRLSLREVDAVAVVNGPGSYTGLRVGLASAKGICYALNKPLITISALTLMSKAAVMALDKELQPVPLLCPMIDARRMEVFTVIQNRDLEEIFPAQAVVLNNESFVNILLRQQVLFFGSGAAKYRKLIDNANAIFATEYATNEALAALAADAYNRNNFADLAYCEPFYLKEFYNG